MKNVLIIFFLFLSYNVVAQTRPTGVPTQFSTGWFRWGFAQSDSGLIIGRRDTTFLPRFTGTVVMRPQDRKFYYYDSTDLRWYNFGTSIDTTSLSNRINLKLNISDTANKWWGIGKRWVDSMYRVNDSTIGFTINNGSQQTFQILGRSASGGGSGTVTSVGLSMPSAFSVSGSPITSSGTFSVSGAGTTAQYIRGNGTLATTDTGMIPSFHLKVRSLFSGTSPITFNQTTGVIGINNANTSGTKGAATFSAAFQDNGSGTIDLLDLGAAGSCTGCLLNIDAKGRITAYSDGPGGATNNANIGAGFRWLNGITQELRTVANSPTITWDSVSTSNTLTAKVDTSIIATQYAISQLVVTADNGLTKTGANIQLGGALIQPTNVSVGTNELDIIAANSSTSTTRFTIDNTNAIMSGRYEDFSNINTIYANQNHLQLISTQPTGSRRILIDSTNGIQIGENVSGIYTGINIEKLTGRPFLNGFPALSPSADTTNNKPLGYNTTTGRIEPMANWTGGGISAQNIQQVLNTGDTSRRGIFFKWDADTSDNICIMESFPSNYNVNYGDEGTQSGFTSGWVRNNGVNASGRPNVVFDLIRYNLGCGVHTSEDASFRFGMETHFNTGGQRLFEFHMPEMTTYAGDVFRPFSMYMNKETGATQFNYGATQGVLYSRPDAKDLFGFDQTGAYTFIGHGNPYIKLVNDSATGILYEIRLNGLSSSVSHNTFGVVHEFDSRIVVTNTTDNNPVFKVNETRPGVANVVGLEIDVSNTSSARTPLQIEASTAGGIDVNFINNSGGSSHSVIGNGNAMIQAKNISATDPSGGGYNAAFSQYVAGNGAAYSFVGMNYGTSAGPYIGSQLFYRTITNDPHVWYTGSTEDMRLTGDGQLGIGTTAPAYGLFVNRTLGANKDSVTLQSTTSTRQMLVIDTSTGKFQRMSIPSSATTIYNGDGTLSGDRIVSSGGNSLTFSGANNSEALISVTNTGTTSTGLYANGTLFGIDAQSTNGIGARAYSANSVGLTVTADNDEGATIRSNSTIGARIQSVPATTNTVQEVLRIERGVNGSPGANGIGGSINFYNKRTDNSSDVGNTIVSKFTDAVAATLTSQLYITGVNGGTPATLATFDGNGNVTFGAANNIVGTATNNNAVAGNIGEEFNSTVSTYTNYTTTATYQNITSITLTAGDWDLSAFFTYSSNSATITAAANAIFAISTTTASASGATEGKNISYVPQAALLGTSLFSDAITPYRVSISSTTTYYLNTQATFTLGNPQFVGGLRARRLR